MAYGRFIDDYYRQLDDIDEILSRMESNTSNKLKLILNQQNIFDYHNIIWDLENMTIDACKQLYPYDNPDLMLRAYENLLQLYKQSLKRYLECAYRVGEWNIIFCDYYQYIDNEGPSVDLLTLLPNDFIVDEMSNEEIFEMAIAEYREFAKRIYLFVSARAGYKPAIVLLKNKYGWVFN